MLDAVAAQALHRRGRLDGGLLEQMKPRG